MARAGVVTHIFGALIHFSISSGDQTSLGGNRQFQDEGAVHCCQDSLEALHVLPAGLGAPARVGEPARFASTALAGVFRDAGCFHWITVESLQL